MGYIYTKSGKLAKRLYFGAVLLFEGLYYTFKNRVLADGGTFVENELPTISQDASLVLTPNAYKAGKLYSAVPNDGTGDFTVDRNSTAPYIDEDGLIKTALANVPRIEAGAILTEPQAINLLSYSENFSNAYWDKIKTTITTNAIISPDGTLNADKLVEDTATGNHFIWRNIGTANGNTYTTTIFVKAAGRSKLALYGGGFASDSAIFDLSTNTITNGANIISSSITDYVNGWKRLSVTLTNRIRQVYIFLKDNNDSDSYIGDGSSGIYIYGAQVEEGTKATSYIPTDGTTVTRLSDNISVPTPAGVTSITETKNGIDQTPITTIPATYSLPVGNINKVKML